jgi:hypothetical protein
MHTLSISPVWVEELNLQHRNGKTFAHGRQETKRQPNLGQRRQVTTSQPVLMFSNLILN